MNKIYYLLLSIIITSSCTDNAPGPEAESNLQSGQPNLIFGHYYGFCHGESCIEVFQLKDNKLYEDTNDNYPHPENGLETNFVELDQSKYDLIKNLNFEIPDELVKSSDTVIGAPDAADGGGIYLELPDGRFWLLDMSKDFLPEYLHPLREEIITAIDLINQ